MKILRNRLLVISLCLTIHLPFTQQLVRGQAPTAPAQDKAQQSPEEAMQLLKAKAASDPWAKYFLAFVYDESLSPGFYDGGMGSQDVPTQAIPYQRAFKAAEYHSSYTVANEKAAALLFKENAEAGHAASMTIYAEILKNGEAGIPKDQAAAQQWLQKAADLGDPAGMFSLAVFYGAQNDMGRVTPLLLKAAENGSYYAMLLLTAAYSKGNGLPKDPAKAAYWQAKSDQIEKADAQNK